MKSIKITILPSLALLGTVIVLTATLSLQPLMAQMPSGTPTRIPLIGGGTVTPIYMGYTPTPVSPSNSVLPTSKPRPTQYIGPTVTPSGSLIAVDITKPIVDEGWTVDNAAIAKVYATLPKTIGTLRVVIPPRDTFYGQFTFALENLGQKGYYEVTVDFRPSAHSAHIAYTLAVNDAINAQTVNVGDAAFVAPQGWYNVAVMHYRNVFVEIYSPNARSNDPMPFTLTEQQLTEVLQTIVKILEQQSPATAVATP